MIEPGDTKLQGTSKDGQSHLISNWDLLLIHAEHLIHVIHSRSFLKCCPLLIYLLLMHDLQ